MRTSTYPIRIPDALILALPVSVGAGMLIVMYVRHGIVGAFIGAITLFWGLLASGAGVWLFRRGQSRLSAFSLAAVAVGACSILCLASLLLYFRAFDL